MELTIPRRCAKSRDRVLRSRLVGAILVVSFGVSPASAFAHEEDPEPYRYVQPPASQGRQDSPNETPHTATSVHPPGALEERIAATDDGQALLTLTAGSLPSPNGSEAIEVTLRPVAPGSLEALPYDAQPIGNAYLLELRAMPSAQPIPSLAAPAILTLSAPSHTDGLIYSSDGVRWEKVEAEELVDGPGTIAAVVDSGYYVQVHDGAVIND